MPTVGLTRPLYAPKEIGLVVYEPVRVNFEVKGCAGLRVDFAPCACRQVFVALPHRNHAEGVDVDQRDGDFGGVAAVEL